MDDSDFISRLPSRLLVSILSLLTFKEAMTTSVLSRRWEKLWTFFHGNLNFNVSKNLELNGCSSYARLVDKVLDELELVQDGCTLECFTIRFNMCPNNFRSVDRWVRFALEKRRVKRLDFDGFSNFSDCSHHFPTYDFPRQYFYAQECNIQALTSARFWSVNVPDEIVGHLLSNCPHLERLELSYIAETLNNLNFSGETLALRHLVIRECDHLTTVLISAPNLVSLNYYSGEKSYTKFIVQNASKLAELSMGYFKTPSCTSKAFHLITCFSFIQKLELHIRSKEPGDSINSIKLPSVKHLTLRASWSNCGHILAWTPVINACPVLQKVTLDMNMRMEREIHGVTKVHGKFPSKCLTEFEFFEFGVLDQDIELVGYFVKHMVRPEKIIVHCNNVKTPFAKFTHPLLVTAKGIAEKLKQTIPEEISLVVVVD